MVTYSSPLASWLQQGERTPAANTMVEYLTRIPACEPGRFGEFPHSAQELRSCLLLLEAEPNLSFHLDELRRLNPQWAVLIEHWEELQQLLRCDNYEATQTSARLRELLSNAHSLRQ